MKCTLGDERLQRSRRSLWCRPWLITFIFLLKTYIMIKGRRNLSRFSVWTSCEHIPQTQRDCLWKRWYESAWVQRCMKSSFFSPLPQFWSVFFTRLWLTKQKSSLTCEGPALNPIVQADKNSSAASFHWCCQYLSQYVRAVKVICINTSHLSKCPNNRPVQAAPQCSSGRLYWKKLNKSVKHKAHGRTSCICIKDKMIKTLQKQKSK